MSITSGRAGGTRRYARFAAVDRSASPPIPSRAGRSTPVGASVRERMDGSRSAAIPRRHWNNETHVQAEEPQAPQQTRLSVAHEDPRRSCDPQPPAPARAAGARRPHRVQERPLGAAGAVEGRPLRAARRAAAPGGAHPPDPRHQGGPEAGQAYENALPRPPCCGWNGSAAADRLDRAEAGPGDRGEKPPEAPPSRDRPQEGARRAVAGRPWL